MGEQIRIVIAEDHPFFRNGLRIALERSRTFSVVAEASDGPTALDHVRALKPDMAIVDIGLPRMNGLAIVRAIRQERLPVEVVFLTIHDDEEIFEESLSLDVKGYLLKDCTESEILRCVRAVASGQHYASPSMTTYLVNKSRRVERFTLTTPGLATLTPHERSILRHIADGKTSKEIAGEMGIAPKTVDTHRANICGKLGVHGQHALSRFATLHRKDL